MANLRSLLLLILVPLAAAMARDEPEAATLREEHFVLELLDPGLEPGLDMLRARLHELELPEGGTPLQNAGLAVCRRRDVGALRTLEWDVRLPHHDARVLHVETSEGASERLVWREIQPGAGRSLTVERVPEGLVRREWAGRQGKREGLHAVQAAHYPLDVLETLRAGGLQDAETVEVFDPLSNLIEPLTTQFGPVGPEGDVEVELLRADGTAAVRYLLRGDELLAFQWQSGRLRGRRVEREAWNRALVTVASRDSAR